jgi:hypothetical protein
MVSAVKPPASKVSRASPVKPRAVAATWPRPRASVEMVVGLTVAAPTADAVTTTPWTGRSAPSSTSKTMGLAKATPGAANWLPPLMMRICVATAAA